MSLLAGQLLEALVAAPDHATFNKLFGLYGPIRESDFDVLARRARDSNAQTRRNAALLLTVAHRSDDRDLILRVLARETTDAAVFVLVCGALANGAELAHQRATLVREALRDRDARIASGALRLAWQAKLPEVADRLREDLVDDRPDVRDSALAILAEAGPGSLEPALRTMLGDPAVRRTLPLTAVFRALLQSDDPTTAELFAGALADSTARSSMSSAIADDTDRKPWVTDFLLAQARAPGPWRWEAFSILAKDPTPATRAVLVEIARGELASELATGAPVGELRWRAGVEASSYFITQLAGHDFSTLQEILEFATAWKPPT